MNPIQHHELELKVQADSKCVFIIQALNSLTEYYSNIDYEIAVEQYLHEKRPLSVSCSFQGDYIEGSYNSNAIYSIRKLLETEYAEQARKAIN